MKNAMRTASVPILAMLVLISLVISCSFTMTAQLLPEGGIAGLLSAGEEKASGAEDKEVSSEDISGIELVANNSAINAGVVMKTGSDFMLYKGSKQAIYTDEDGSRYGAPFKTEDTVYVPLKHIARLVGRYAPTDDVTFDLTVGDRATTLVVGSKDVVIGTERVQLKYTPYYSVSDSDKKFVVISMEDVHTIYPELYVTYDEMGLIAVTRAENVFDRATDLTAMVNLMKSFIFDHLNEAQLYAKIEENTNGFDHPYLIADDEQFEYLHKVYEAHTAKEAGESYNEEYIDDTLFKLLKRTLNSANSCMDIYTTLPDEPVNYTYEEYAYERDPGKYKLLAFEITNPFYGIKNGEKYTDKEAFDYLGAPDENGDYWGKRGEHYNDGYDWAGSRNSHGCSYADNIRDLALAYRITGDESYAQLSYDVMISLCDNENWHNWSHKHHLSTGEMLIDLGLAYDWMYDKWSELQHQRDEEYSLSHITQQMYRKGIYYSYDVSRYARTSDVWTRDQTSPVNKDGYITGIWNWAKCDINWNCVCNSGIVMAAMAIVSEPKRLPDVDFTRDGKDGTDRVLWCMANNLNYMSDYGLVQYAPDGSYIESPGYWSYATNYLATIMWAVKTATGDDLGFYEAWGIDKTFYYAVQTEYPVITNSGQGYQFWNYHDSGAGVQNTSLFFFASQMLNDDALAAIRLDHIAKGKSISFTDLLGYRPEYKDLTMENVELVRDYRLEACEGVVSRDSWDSGCLFVGLMGNENDCTAHSQIDSGVFTYANKNYTWFVDLGADEYNVYEYFGYGYSGTRMKYYRNNAEGHNVICMTSRQSTMPHGQYYYDGGKIVEFVSEEDGMYAILDNAGAYGGYAEYANRGLLLTNSRYTTVIQDEIKFKGVESVVWIGHTAADITLSDDGRVAYLRKYVEGKYLCLRATLLTDNQRLRFDKIGAGSREGDFLLDITRRPGWSQSMGGLAEYSRASYKRLIVRADNVTELKMAVVLEIVGTGKENEPTAYTYTDMADWTVTAGNGYLEEDIPYVKDYSQQLADVKYYSTMAERYINEDLAFTKRYVEFYTSLYNTFVSVKMMGMKNLQSNEEAYAVYNEKYLPALAKFEAYRAYVNSCAELSGALLNSGKLVYCD